MAPRDVAVVPDFFVLGAPRAGTTSLCTYLARHPGIAMSNPKETRFWGSDAFPHGLAAYGRDVFRERQPGQLAGDGDPDNLFLGHVPQRIASAAAGAKLVVVLREPVDRAYSHWWMEYSQGVERLPFEAAVDANLADIKRSGPAFEGPAAMHDYLEYQAARRRGTLTRRIYLDFGQYARAISGYLTCFPRGQLKVVSFDALRDAPAQLLADVADFLGIDPPPDDLLFTAENASFRSLRVSRLFGGVTRAIAWTRVPRLVPERWRAEVWPRLWSRAGRVGRQPRLEPRLRDRLSAYYESEVPELAEVLGDDVECWFRR